MDSALCDNFIKAFNASRKICTNSHIALASSKILREVTLAEVEVDGNHALSGVGEREGEVYRYKRFTLVRHGRSHLNYNSLTVLALHHILDVTANDTQSLRDAVLTRLGNDNFLVLLLLLLARQLAHDRNVGDILHIFASVNLGVERINPENQVDDTGRNKHTKQEADD